MDYLRVHNDEATIEHVDNPSFITALQLSRHVYESRYAVNDRTPAYQSAILLQHSRRAAHVDHHSPDEWIEKALKAARSRIRESITTSSSGTGFCISSGKARIQKLEGVYYSSQEGD